MLAPALCTETDAQGGIRFSQIGTAADGFTSSETAFQSWLHKIMVIKPFFNGLSPFSTIFHRALCKINSQTHLKFIQGAAAPNEPYFNSTYTMKITIVNLINLSEAIYHTNVPLLKCNK